jgi:hypothetical protein
MWVALAILLIVVIGIAVVATAVLTLGTLLAHIFPVSTFEASVVVMVVAAAWVLLLRTEQPIESEDAVLVGEAEDDEPPIVFRAVPVPARRRPRRRKR